MAFVGAFLASGSFLANDYFESENKKEKFAFELHQRLYDEGAKVLNSVNRAYSELYSMYAEDFALTPYQLSEKYFSFRKSLELYADYIDELQRYGSTEQLQVVSNHREWLWGIYAELDMQFRLSEQVAESTKELLLVEDANSELFKALNKTLDSQIINLVRNENRIFYTIGDYKKPVVDSLEQYINYQFRSSLGIPATKDMADKINALPELAERSNDFKFKEKKLPFVFAKGRVFQSPELEFGGDISSLEMNNEILAYNSKMKFISSVLDSDESLRNLLEERNEKHLLVEDNN